ERLLSRLVEVAPDADAFPLPVASRIHAVRAVQALREGEVSRCLEEQEVAIRGTEEAGDRRTACLARLALSDTLFYVGDADRAAGVVRAGLTDADAIGIEGAQPVLRVWLARALSRSKPAEALEAAELAIARAHEDSPLRGLAFALLAELAWRAADYASAESHA